MTVFLMKPRLADDFDMKKSVTIMAHGADHDMPAVTLIPGNPDFPISDLTVLGQAMTAALMGLPVTPQKDIGNSYIHYAQAENGEKLGNGYKLRFRTANSGITAEEGVFVAVNPSLPAAIQTEIHERFSKVIRNTLNAFHPGGLMPSPGLPPTLKV